MFGPPLDIQQLLLGQAVRLLTVDRCRHAAGSLNDRGLRFNSDCDVHL